MLVRSASAQLNEILGYLARWSLLALATLLVVVVVWMVAAATADVPLGGRGGLTLSDLLWARSGPLDGLALGQVTPPYEGEVRNLPVLCRASEGRLAQGYLTSNGVRVALTQPTVGPNVIEVRGVPWDYRGMHVSGMTGLVLPSGGRLFLLGAGEYGLADDHRRKWIEQLVEALEPRGYVVWMFGGSPEAFVERCATLRRTFPSTLIVYIGRADPITRHGLRAFVRISNAHSLDTAVVTTRAALAEIAGKLGLETHLVGHDWAIGIPASVHTYSSVAKFKDSLPATPIQP